MKLHKIISLFLMAFAAHAFCQIGFSVDAESGYASNIFGNYRQLPDYYQYVQGHLNYDLLGESHGVRTFYQGSATLFEQYDYRSFSLHRAGLSYYKNFDTAKLSAGLSGNMRFHSDDYKWYEYQQGYGFLNVKLALRPQLFGYVGTNIRLRDYDNLSPYSYWQNVNYLRLSRSFNTGTSLIGEVDYMQKVYRQTNAQPIENFSELHMDGDGQSRQVVGLLQIGQAVTPTTGLSAQALLRRSLKSSVRYLVDEEGYYYSDEELFDDPFGYDAEQFNITLKQKLPWKVEASVGGMFLQKHYSTRLALDLDGLPHPDERLRDDHRVIGWLSISKAWKYNSSMAPVRFTLDLSIIKNTSNDPYYIYNTRNFSIGLSQNF